MGGKQMLDHSCQAHRHPLEERGLDLYETPAVAIEALLRVEPIPRRVWEPAAGRGAIVNVLRAAGHEVVASDIADYGFPLDFHRDFLAEAAVPAGVEAIVTNPPFRYAEEFVARALDLCPLVIMLLRAAFYESERRTSILENCGLARKWVFRKRLPMMHRDNWAGPKASSGMSFAWFVWNRSHAGDTAAKRLSWEDDRDAPVLLPQGRPVNGSHSRSHLPKRGTNRAYVLPRLRRDGRADLAEQVESGTLSVRRALAAITRDKRTSR
jgi:hypothetical protein